MRNVKTGSDDTPKLMLGGRLQIPQGVLDAQRNGRLVIFAGAGVSREKPSSLPLFHELVKQIAGRKLNSEERKRPDRLLGELFDTKGIDIHFAAKGILGRDSSQPTNGHRSLIDLFPDSANLRIVTTNADRHFTTVLREKDPLGLVESYYAPALPLGNDFAGLVYLHGSVAKDPRHMVLTDQDFGRAYLTDAYAVRFLERLFAEFTVLFVGYSHQDFMMEFLGRGLYRSQPRFALTNDDSSDAVASWESLGIQPVFFDLQSAPNKYAELWEGLAYWAACVQESQSDREQRIRQIVAISATELVHPSSFVGGKDLSYLEWRLREASGARFFVQHAKHPAWLLWLESQPVFKVLFSTEGEAGSVGGTLAEWFCEHFVVGNGGAIGLALAERHHPHLHPVLWHRVMRTLAYATAEKREPHKTVGKWIGLLLASWQPTCNCEPLEVLLGECQLPSERDFVVVLFDFLSRPRVKLERGFDLKPGEPAEAAEPRATLRSIGDPTQLLMDFVQRRLPGHEETLFELLLPIVEHHLAVGHQLLLMADEASRDFDEASFRRAAIEPHEQNSSPEMTDVLVDTARLIVEWAADTEPQLLDAYTRRWIEASVPLLRRLAVYATARRADRSADERLQWLVDHDLLFTLPEKHEVFGLLETSFAAASADSQLRILEAVVSDTGKAESPHERMPSDYERYNVLVWLDRCAPGLESVSGKLIEASKAHPEYKPRTDPDLGYKIEVGFVPGPEEADVNTVLAMQPAEVCAWVQACKSAPFNEDACYTRPRVVKAAVAKSVHWGLRLADALVLRPCKADLWVHVIDGFKLASKSPDDWSRILSLFAGDEKIQEKHALHIAWFLREGLASSKEPIPRVLYPDVLSLAMSVWRVHTFEPPDQRMGWSTASLNTTGGVLAEIVVAQLSKLRQSPEKWEGLPNHYRKALDGLLYSREESAPYARVALSRGLHVLYDCDPDWTLQHIIPLLDWKKNAEHALQSWYGFLFAPRLPEECLSLLLPQYAEAVARLKSAEDDLAEVLGSLAGHIASILLFTGVDPYADNWIGRVLSKSSLELRVALAERVQWLLGHIEDVSQREEHWQMRLKPYWVKRLDGSLPRLQENEIATMVEWVLPLASCLPSVAVLIQSSESTAMLDQGFFWRLAKKEVQIRQYPSETANLCTHLVQAFPDDVAPYRVNGLDRVIKVIESSNVDAVAMQALREEALRLGIGRGTEH